MSNHFPAHVLAFSWNLPGHFLEQIRKCFLCLCLNFLEYFLNISGWLPMGISRNQWIPIKTNKNNRIREGLASKIMENAWISSQNLRKNFFIFIFSRKSQETQPIPPRAHRFFQETHGGSKIGSWAIFIDLAKDVVFRGCGARWSQSMKNDATK